MPLLVDRARQRHDAAGVLGVDVRTGDRYAGCADAAPFDRLVGWTCPHLIPQAWIQQATSDAVIVTPVKIAPLAVANAIVAIKLADGRPSGVQVRPGGFIEMHPEPITEFGLPIRYVDAVSSTDGAEPWWISTEWMHAAVLERAASLLDRLRHELQLTACPLGESKDAGSFTAWLYATRPDGLATAGLSDRYFAVGATTEDGAAWLSEEHLAVAGSGDAIELLGSWIDGWRAAGLPAWGEMTGVVEPVEDGWQIRLRSGERFARHPAPKGRRHSTVLSCPSPAISRCPNGLSSRHVATRREPVCRSSTKPRFSTSTRTRPRS